MAGRCWPNDGTGGTLNVHGTEPGPYYALAAPGMPLVGSGADGRDLPHRAVAAGVLALQRAVNRARPRHLIRADGIYGADTQQAIADYQRSNELTVDGVVGRETARSLFVRTVNRLATASVPACLIDGQIANESAYDPGAVGYADERDLGLLQINGYWHPDLTEAERFSPIVSIDYAIGLYMHALGELNGNLRDSVAAYNLGIGGARSWIKRGRPDVDTTYTPPREVKLYVDRILSRCSTAVSR